MRIDNKTIFELNCIGFNNYVKNNPTPKPVGIGTPIKDELQKQIGREPTLPELKKYIELVVMPAHDFTFYHKKVKSLIRLVNKNDKERQTKRYEDSNQLQDS